MSNLKVIARRRVTRSIAQNGFNSFEDPQLMVTVTASPPDLTPLDAVFIFEFNLITLVIEPKDGTLEEVLGWLAYLTPGVSQDEVKAVKTWVDKISSHLPTIREMRLAINNGGLVMFYLDLEIDVDFGKSLDGSGKAAFFVRLNTPPSFYFSLFCLPYLPRRINTAHLSIYSNVIYKRTLHTSERYTFLPNMIDITNTTIYYSGPN
jgi:hypothetical protein